MNPATGSLHHLAIQARDYDKSVHFYKEVLGMEEVASVYFPSRKGMFLSLGNGSLIELFAPQNDGSTDLPEYENNGLVLWHFALAVEDVSAATEHCREAGYEVTVEPKEIQFEGGFHATISFVLGPNGEAVEFFDQHHSWDSIS
jgi:catechol 2,3-dioxygenase-like lactoylglutathione lyase family enzyme